MSRPTHRTVLWLVAAMGVAAACAPPLEGSVPCDATSACATGAYCHEDGFCWSFAQPEVSCSGGIERTPVPDDALDLLLVIDDSYAMDDVQALVVVQLERVLRSLTSGDLDLDGTVDGPRFGSVHVGIVTTDMATGLDTVESCSFWGDDGLLQRRGDPATSCLAATVSPIFAFAAESDVESSIGLLGCVASVGTAGCGLQQPLDAALKALSLAPSPDGTSPVAWTRDGYVPPTFFRETFGHAGAGGANEGFLREGSILAVVMVTNDEDCSARNPAIFDRTHPDFSEVDICCRCERYASELHTTQRYIEGLIGLRRTPQHLFFGVVAGVPLHVAGLGPAAVLDDPDMVPRRGPPPQRQRIPSCRSEPPGYVAYPPRRIVEVAGGLASLGATISLQSICDPSLAPAFDDLLSAATQLLAGRCIGFAPAGGPEGVACEVLETLPAGVRCEDLPFPEARASNGTDEDGRSVCVVRQVTSARAGLDAGWTLGRETFDGGGCGMHVEPSLITFGPEARYAVRCAPGVTDGPALVAPGVSCDPATGLVLGASATCADASLACDVATSTCERPCASDADCAALGLRCVQQPLEAWCRTDLASAIDRRAVRAICN